MADLDPCIGSEQGGIRPVVIIKIILAIDLVQLLLLHRLQQN